MQWIEDDNPIEQGNKPYVPKGGARAMFACKAKEVLIEGPANTGKSRGVLEKIHIAMSKYPGARGLLLRQTRVALTQSALVTFEEKVLPVGHYLKNGATRSHRESYRYSNGSELVCGGLDRAERIMSTEWDMVGLFEATEANEHDFSMLSTRTRNSVMPYNQVIADCNPAGPTHWLNARASTDAMTRILSRHVDNPFCTEDYLDGLRKLPPTLRARLYEGKWVQSDGLVYDNFNREVNVCVKEGPWKKAILCADDGYTDPFALYRIELDPDGRGHISQGMYRTGMVESAKVEAVRSLVGDGVEMVVVDSAAASLIAALRDAGLPVEGCKKGPDSIVNGCHKVRERFAKAGDGLPRLTIDPSMTDVLNEIDTYEWSKRRDGNTKDTPVDQNNHAMDAIRYGINYLDAGGQPFAEVIGGKSPVVAETRTMSQQYADNRKDIDWGFG